MRKSGKIGSAVAGALLSPLFYTVFGSLLFIFHIVQIICHRLGGYNAHKRSVDILNLLLLRCFWLTGTTVRMSGFELIPGNRPLIIVANHQSAFDIPPVVWGFRKFHVKFISKKELGRFIPSISYNLRHGGSVLIDRANRLQSVKEITRLGEFIARNNYAACIFPEGTRSRDGHVRTFKPAGIASLLKAAPNALIVPFAISGNYLINRNNSIIVTPFLKLRYTVLPPIDPQGLSADDVVTAAEEAVRQTVG